VAGGLFGDASTKNRQIVPLREMFGDDVLAFGSLLRASRAKRNQQQQPK
jgi:hypothetical protein